MKSFPPETLEVLRKYLLSEKKTCETRLGELTLQDPFRDPDRTSDNAASDRDASEESGHDRVAALTDELKIRLNEIESALDRIKQGSYGFCLNCKAMIDTDRLAIHPTATLCVACESTKNHTR